MTIRTWIHSARLKFIGWGVITALAVLGLGFWHLAQRAAPAGIEVPGGDGGGLPRADAESEGFDAAALQGIVSYARRSGAQALLVTRHAHLLVEHYDAGLDERSAIDTGAFAELLVALAAGIALHEHALPLPQDLRLVDATAADRLAGQIATASQLSYPQFLSRNIWQPLNAARAHFLLSSPAAALNAGCCLAARSSDWLRVAELLIADGRFEGTQVLPAGWAQQVLKPSAEDPGRAFGVWLAASAHGAEPFVAHDVFFLRGVGRTHLYVAPRLHIAILLLDTRAATSSDDETRLPNLVFRALRAGPGDDRQKIGELVPGHSH
ncbi:MAG: hypothetical protein WCD08_13565 [Steroidobacteraceae bacterium]